MEYMINKNHYQILYYKEDFQNTSNSSIDDINETEENNNEKHNNSQNEGKNTFDENQTYKKKM